jgi:uncharacterized phiE125 gp8 family phage protein
MWARVEIVTRGAVPVSVLDMRAHCRVDGAAEDLAMSEFLAAAAGLIDGPEGVGIALLSQTWRVTLDDWADRIDLPGWPVTSISGVQYLDAAGSWQTLDHAAAFHFLTGGQNAELVRRPGAALPALADAPKSVRISYALGHATPAAIDPSLINALKMIAAHYFENREAATDRPMAETPLGVDHILARYRRGMVA